MGPILGPKMGPQSGAPIKLSKRNQHGGPFWAPPKLVPFLVPTLVPFLVPNLQKSGSGGPKLGNIIGPPGMWFWTSRIALVLQLAFGPMWAAHQCTTGPGNALLRGAMLWSQFFREPRRSAVCCWCASGKLIQGHQLLAVGEMLQRQPWC